MTTASPGTQSPITNVSEAEGAIAKRGIFDDQHEALPAVKVFGVAQEQ